MNAQPKPRSRINVALLLRVADAIAKYPEQFDMRYWNCGTTFCIGGWAHRLTGLDLPWNLSALHCRDSSKVLLGLSSMQADELFYESYWPAHFWHWQRETPTERTAKAVARIYHFLDQYAHGWRDQHRSLAP